MEAQSGEHLAGLPIRIYDRHFTAYDLVFTGDTLFKQSVGRTDLPGGSGRDLLDSIITKLLTLDDDTRVLPGHGEGTTIGAERLTNPFLQGITSL